MIITRIVQLADGEELISYESRERQRTSALLDDPRRGLLERRGLVEAIQRRGEQRRVADPS